jgi:hypothetical protein
VADPAGRDRHRRLFRRAGRLDRDLEPDPAAQDAMGDNVFAADRWQPVLDAAIEQGRRTKY